MTHKKMRIAKLLANYNQGSRREIERLIAKKKSFLIKSCFKPNYIRRYKKMRLLLIIKK